METVKCRDCSSPAATVIPGITKKFNLCENHLNAILLNKPLIDEINQEFTIKTLEFFLARLQERIERERIIREQHETIEELKKSYNIIIQATKYNLVGSLKNDCDNLSQKLTEVENENNELKDAIIELREELKRQKSVEEKMDDVSGIINNNLNQVGQDIKEVVRHLDEMAAREQRIVVRKPPTKERDIKQIEDEEMVVPTEEGKKEDIDKELKEEDDADP